MLILAIDTSLAACSACLADTGAVLARKSEPMARGHQERLAPMVRDLMVEVGVAFADLDRVAVTIGPGSFTGLRVGLAFAKGLGLALKRPVAGVGTLEALAMHEPDGDPIVAAIDAGRGHIYVQAFSAGTSRGPPARLLLASATDWLDRLVLDGRARSDVVLIGPGAAFLAAEIGGGRVADRAFPSARVVAALGAREPPSSAAPLYLRPPDATPKAHR